MDNASESNASHTICVNDNRNYFCHSCNMAIRITSEGNNCPICHRGFIELLETLETNNTINIDLVMLEEDNRHQRSFPFQPVSHPEIRSFLSRHTNNSFVDYLVASSDLVTNSILLPDIWVENHGPPPLTENKIQEIPTAHISQDHIDMKLQCAVCLEDFTINEVVMKLTCGHMYHKGCITPWLKIHGTCPSCRVYFGDEGAVVPTDYNEIENMFRQSGHNVASNLNNDSIFAPSSEDETMDVEDMENELRESGTTPSLESNLINDILNESFRYASPQTLSPRDRDLSDSQVYIISSDDESDVEILEDTPRKCDSGDSAQSSLTQSTSSQIPPPKVSNLRNIQEYTISSDDE